MRADRAVIISNPGVAHVPAMLSCSIVAKYQSEHMPRVPKLRQCPIMTLFPITTMVIAVCLLHRKEDEYKNVIV